MLFGSNLLDFAVGLVLIYFLLSLFCSWLNERWASARNLRAKTLEDGLKGLLGKLAPELLQHPLIQGLSNQHGSNAPIEVSENINNKSGRTFDKRTSYITPSTFSTTLVHLVTARSWTNGLTKLSTAVGNLAEAAKNLPPVVQSGVNAVQVALKEVESAHEVSGALSADVADAVQKLRQTLNALPSGTDYSAVLAALDRLPLINLPAAGTTTEPVIDLQAFRKAVALIEFPDVRKSLLAIIDTTQGDINDVQQNIEAWFNDAMERLSGWYKRRTQFFILLAAFGVALILNADSIKMADGLWHNDASRQAAVAEAQKVIQSTGQGPQTSGGATGSTGATGATGATGSSGGSPSIMDLCGQEGATTCVESKIQGLQVPIGYAFTDPKTGGAMTFFGERWREVNIGTGFSDYIIKLAGLAATAVAISLGAPFWFDLLSKLVNLRNTGEPPKTTTDQNGKAG